MNSFEANLSGPPAITGRFELEFHRRDNVVAAP